MIAVPVRNATSGRPRSRLFWIARRISRRFGPEVAAAYLRAVSRLQAGIDGAALESAIASGDLNQVVSAIGPTRLGAIFLGSDSLAEILEKTAKATGIAGAEVLSGALGVSVQFNRVDPNVVLYARQQSSTLVVAITEDVREAVRIVVAIGAAEGLTVRQQAVAIRQVVGLPPNWAAAPSSLARELKEGRFTSSRRLSAIDKARIRKALRTGTVTESFVDEMRAKYAASLTNRRALNIARTETLRSSNFGLREEWRQAQQQNVLPATARRMWIVTPDDRLRDTHAAVPGMNPDGVPIGGAFQTPLGPSFGPPLEPLCRCGEGLVFPGRKGVL
jgi:hypothetical protein